MKAYIIMRWNGDSYGHGDYVYLGVCLTYSAAYDFAAENAARFEEVDILDVGFLPPKEDVYAL